MERGGKLRRKKYSKKRKSRRRKSTRRKLRRENQDGGTVNVYIFYSV